jgi:hypothetical protein
MFSSLPSKLMRRDTRQTRSKSFEAGVTSSIPAEPSSPVHSAPPRSASCRPSATPIASALFRHASRGQSRHYSRGVADEQGRQLRPRILPGGSAQAAGAVVDFGPPWNPSKVDNALHGPATGGARNPACPRGGRVPCPGCEDRKDSQRKLFRTWGLAVRDANVERHSTAS